MSNYSYELLSPPQSRKRRPLWIAAICMIFLLVAVNIVVLRGLRAPPSVLDNYQPLNPISPIHTGLVSSNDKESPTIDIPFPEERAVVTTLYSESFVNAVLALGHSLGTAQVKARRIILYFPDKLSRKSICQLEAIGWELRPISRIPPPNGGRGIHQRFLDQYSKLQLWTLDAIGIKSVVYLDGDMIVRQSFDELWSLPFEFAAVPDVYGDARGFALSFNAGMMLLRTSTEVYNDMISKIDSADYRRLDAEQGFLNLYFATQVVRLPYIYNANLVIQQRSPALWRAIERDTRVVHYTMMKPFIEKYRGKAKVGLWQDELNLWDAAWSGVSMRLENLESKCL